MPNMLPINNGPPIWFVMLPAQRAVDHWKLSPPFSVDLTWWKHGIKTNAVVRRSSRKDNRETPSENHFTIMPFSTETRISKRYLWRRWHAPPALGQERGKCSTYQAKTNWIFISTIYSSRMLTLFFRSFLVLSLQIVCAGGSCPPSFSAVDRPEQPTTVSSKHRKTAAVLWNLCLRWKHFLPLGCRIGRIRRGVKEGKKRKTVLRAWEAFKKKEARNHVSKREPRPQVFPPGGSQCGVCYRFCVFPRCAVRGGKAKQVLFSTG